ncbi:MAG: hypothetical protein M9894_34025 [Planctomycetes bacterium]|nr:hypothetical protein [Planctomycetota bacterium]
MKPACSPRGRRAALAAARAALRADLGWLRGYPVGRARAGALPWLVVPAPARGAVPREVTVDRARLREASGALACLPRRFPRALPALVGGEGAAWVERAREVLGWLGAAVHEGAPLPGIAERLAGLDPALVARALAAPAAGPLVDALAWVHALDPARLTAALEQVVTRAEGLGRLVAACPDAGPLTVGLVGLALDAPRGPAAGLLDLLGREAPWTIALEADPAPLEALAAALERKRPPPAEGPAPRPSAPLGPALVDLAGDALALDGGARDRALGVLVAVAPAPLVERWARWWAQVAARAAAARRLLAAPGGVAQRDERRAVARVGGGSRAAARPSRRRGELARRARRSALPAAAGERLLDVLGAIDPELAVSWGDAARLALAMTVQARRCDPTRALGVLAQVLRAAPGAFGGGAVLLAAELIDEAPRLLRHAPLVVDALVGVARRGGRLDASLALTLALELAARVGDARAAAAFLRALEAADARPRSELPALLVALCGRDPARLPAVLGALGTVEWPRAHADALAALAARDDARALLCDALAAGEVGRARRLALLSGIIAGLAGALDEAPPPAPVEGDVADARGALAREAAALESARSRPRPSRAGASCAAPARLGRRLAGHDVAPARRRRAAARRAARRRLRARPTRGRPPSSAAPRPRSPPGWGGPSPRSGSPARAARRSSPRWSTCRTARACAPWPRASCARASTRRPGTCAAPARTAPSWPACAPAASTRSRGSRGSRLAPGRRPGRPRRSPCASRTTRSRSCAWASPSAPASRPGRSTSSPRSSTRRTSTSACSTPAARTPRSSAAASSR